MRRGVWLTVGLVLLATGCTDQTAGTPTAAGEAPDTTAESTATPSSTAGPADSIKPCALLSAADISQLGITGAPRSTKIKGAVSCDWRVEKKQVGDSYTVGISVFPGLGLKDVTGSPKTPTTVGKHDAVQVINNSSGCAVALGITETSRVQVYVTGGDPAGLCKPALDIAKIIEPKLP